MTPLFEIDKHDQFKSYSLKDLLALCFKHKKLITRVFVIVAVCVNTMLFYIPSVYTINAKVLIRTETQGTPSFFAGVVPVKERLASDPVKRVIETEMQMVEGREVAEQVVKELSLKWDEVYHKPLVHIFEPIGTYLIDPVMSLLGFDKDPRKNGFDDTVKALLESISVAPEISKSADTSSNIFVVSLKSTDAVLGRDVLSKILNAYREYEVKEMRKAAEDARYIVNEKVNESYSVLSTAQLNLETFLGNKKDGTVEANGRLLTSPNDRSVILMIEEEIIGLEFELSTLRDRYKPANDNVLRIKRLIEKLRVRLRREMMLFARNHAELSTLERDLQQAETIYLKLKERLSEIELFIDMNEQNINSKEILESPLVPRESSWKKDMLLGVFGAIIGLVFGVMFAGIREYFGQGIRDDMDIAKFLGIESLGKIPEERGDTITSFLEK